MSTSKEINLKIWFYTKTESDDKFVQKVDGKTLSANDYTNADKSKLDNIQAGATKTIIDSSLSSTSTNPVENKAVSAALATKATSNDLSAVATSGSYDDLDDQPAIPTKVSDLDNDMGYVQNVDIQDLGGVVTVVQQEQPESGFAATYVVKQGGTQVGPKINIPKDFLVKSGSVQTVGASGAQTASQLGSGFATGDKYLDFVINTPTNSETAQHVYINVKDLVEDTLYAADESTLTLNNGVFSIKSGIIPQANTIAGNIKMNGTQSAGSAATWAKADHVHPVDTSRAASSHSHGSITTDGKLGSTSGKPLITGTNGVIQVGSFGTSAGTFASGDHTHSQYLESADVNDKLEFEDLDDIIGLAYNETTGVLSITLTDPNA